MRSGNWFLVVPKHLFNSSSPPPPTKHPNLFLQLAEVHCIIYYSLLEVLKWLMSNIECTSCFHIHAKACDVCSNLSSGKLYNGRNFLSISSHCQCWTTACAPWCSNGSSSSSKWVLSNGLCTSGSGYKEHLPELLWNWLHVLIIMHAKACDVATMFLLGSGEFF